MPRPDALAPGLPMADPREPVDVAGPGSMAEGRALAGRGITALAEGLPTVPEGPVG